MRMFARFRRSLAVGGFVLAGGIGLTATGQSNVPAPKVDVDRLGPRVGEGLPDFSLRDQRGEMRSLKSLLGPNGAMIVFFRSADW
ncbi:MAG: hypothetical protein ABIS06_12000 [Vicinamibacterales bacterium]